MEGGGWHEKELKNLCYKEGMEIIRELGRGVKWRGCDGVKWLGRGKKFLKSQLMTAIVQNIMLNIYCNHIHSIREKQSWLGFGKAFPMMSNQKKSKIGRLHSKF